MIRLSESAITVIMPDGTEKLFEADDFQSSILMACVSSGTRDLWIAEDIVLSLEFALAKMTAATGQQRIHFSELNETVSTILEEAGYPDAACDYRNTNRSSYVEISGNQETISKLIAKHLAADSDAYTKTAEKVSEALRLLKVATARPELILELARYYSALPVKAAIEAERQNEIPNLKIKKQRPAIDADKIYTQLSETTRKLTDDKLIQFSGLSKIFPSIKIEIKLQAFASLLKADPPLTELQLIPVFSQIAAAVDEIAFAGNSLQENAKEMLPVWIAVPDMSAFARQSLQCQWPESAKYCRSMMDNLCSFMKTDVFKVTVK